MLCFVYNLCLCHMCCRCVSDLCRLPIWTGTVCRLLQERFSSVRERISPTHSGNTPRRLWDMFRLFSWENLKRKGTNACLSFVYPLCYWFIFYLYHELFCKNIIHIYWQKEQMTNVVQKLDSETYDLFYESPLMLCKRSVPLSEL